MDCLAICIYHYIVLKLKRLPRFLSYMTTLATAENKLYREYAKTPAAEYY